MWLLVGLGNPGSKYERTRHNAGFRVLDEIATRRGASASRTKLGADLAEAAIGAERVLLCKPMEFMNTSGQSVMRVAQFWKIPPERTVVIYDELDLPFCRLKLGAGGGHGGHNGVRSVITEWGTAAFHRVRFGIGRPPAGSDPVAYVLSDFAPAEQAPFQACTVRAAEASETVVTEGIVVAMNRFNSKTGAVPKIGDDA